MLPYTYISFAISTKANIFALNDKFCIIIIFEKWGFQDKIVNRDKTKNAQEVTFVPQYSTPFPALYGTKITRFCQGLFF